MADGPKKYDTTPTMPRARVDLAPIHARHAPTDAEVGDALDLSRDLQDHVATLEPCPACAACGICHGTRMVERTKAAEYVALMATVKEDDDEASST